jgi:FtsH-binding integral membrane protein
MKLKQSLIALAAGGTGAIFFTLSSIAAVSKRDFTGMGKFLFAGMILILLAAVANIFFQVPALVQIRDLNPLMRKQLLITGASI